MIGKFVCSMTVAGLMVGCASVPRANDEPRNVTSGQVYVRLLENPCQSDIQQESLSLVVLSLAAPLVKGMLEKGFEAGASYLKTLSDARAASVVGVGNKMDFLSVFSNGSATQRVACLHFGVGAEDLATLEYEPTKFHHTAALKLHETGEGLIYEIVLMDFFFKEAVSAGRGGKDIVLTYESTFPTIRDSAGKPFVVQSVFAAAEDIRPGTRITYPESTGLRSSAELLPLSDDIVQAAKARVGGQPLSVPVSVRVTMTETDKGKGALLLLKLSEALGKAGPPVAEAVAGKLSD